MRALQPTEEFGQVGESAFTGEHQIHQFVAVGQNELRLRDRLAEQPARPQRKPAALTSARRHRLTDLRDHELRMNGFREHGPHHIADLVSFIDQLGLNGFVIVGQDWGGPQGVAAALERRSRLGAMVLMSTWAFTGEVGRFHSSPRPWTTWQAPLIGQFFMKRLKVLSQHGPSATSKRGMSELEARAYELAGEEFMLGSTQQVARVLFERLGLTPGRKGKTGYSTDTRVLRTIRGEHPVVEVIEEWRELSKLVNTYLVPLPSLISERDGRLHTTFNQAVAATGRLSTTSPNLQAIPVRTDLGRQIRSAFVAHQVICIRDQAHVTPDQQLAFAARWGEISIHPYIPSIEGYPGVMKIYDPNAVTQAWHADSTHVDAGTALFHSVSSARRARV
mgnify:CR=1 FL=1